jgi:hypothetical protein
MQQARCSLEEQFLLAASLKAGDNNHRCSAALDNKSGLKFSNRKILSQA